MHNLPFPVIRSDERRCAVGWMLSATGWFSIVAFVLLCLALMAIVGNVNESLALILCVGLPIAF